MNISWEGFKSVVVKSVRACVRFCAFFNNCKGKCLDEEVVDEIWRNEVGGFGKD